MSLATKTHHPKKKPTPNSAANPSITENVGLSGKYLATRGFSLLLVKKRHGTVSPSQPYSEQ